MFKIAEWEDDIPINCSNKINETKKGKSPTFLNISVSEKESNKRKDIETENSFFSSDLNVVSLNAKRQKLNEAFKNQNCADFMFVEKQSIDRNQGDNLFSAINDTKSRLHAGKVFTKTKRKIDTTNPVGVQLNAKEKNNNAVDKTSVKRDRRAVHEKSVAPKNTQENESSKSKPKKSKVIINKKTKYIDAGLTTATKLATLKNKESLEKREFTSSLKNQDLQISKKNSNKKINKKANMNNINPEPTRNTLETRGKHSLSGNKHSINKTQQETNKTTDRSDNESESHEKRSTNQKKDKLKNMLLKNNITQKIKDIKAQEARATIPVRGRMLREKMLEKLKAAQFRYLNEKLYTSSGSEAQQLFESDPTAFQTYHQGYQQQLKKWPVNPLDVIVAQIKKMPKSHVIADMGCGEAALTQRVSHTVRSFDLVSAAPGVEACDMARTPLLAASVDVVVYCLALMGTDLTKYLVEANRVLKMGGKLLIAEVESRFENVETFINDLKKLGFKLTSRNEAHKVFFFLYFQKVANPVLQKAKLPKLSLKPCMYMKR